MSRQNSPPRWAEALLEKMLAPDDRETVIGDLREEYAEAVRPEWGRWRADAWYFRQAASLVRRSVYQEGGMRAMLLMVSAFSLACGCWLVAMEVILGRPGYAARVAMDASLSLVPLATILVILLHPGVRVERWFRLCGLPLIVVALWAFVRNARSPHFEGFAMIISLALALQGTLLLVALGNPRRGLRPDRMA